MERRRRTSAARAKVERVVGERWARRARVTDFHMKALRASSVEMKVEGESFVAVDFRTSSDALEKEKDAQVQSGGLGVCVGDGKMCLSMIWYLRFEGS